MDPFPLASCPHLTHLMDKSVYSLGSFPGPLSQKISFQTDLGHPPPILTCHLSPQATLLSLYTSGAAGRHLYVVPTSLTSHSRMCSTASPAPGLELSSKLCRAVSVCVGPCSLPLLGGVCRGRTALSPLLPPWVWQPLPSISPPPQGQPFHDCL